ncbi:unnamed protein product [Symbiodinium sp. CCMP2456]|nr:unnamed protein product [Symbiodinium sp. CCMP2456]
MVISPVLPAALSALQTALAAGPTAVLTQDSLLGAFSDCVSRASALRTQRATFKRLCSRQVIKSWRRSWKEAPQPCSDSSVDPPWRS